MPDKYLTSIDISIKPIVHDHGNHQSLQWNIFRYLKPNFFPFCPGNISAFNSISLTQGFKLIFTDDFINHHERKEPNHHQEHECNPRPYRYWKQIRKLGGAYEKQNQ